MCLSFTSALGESIIRLMHIIRAAEAECELENNIDVDLIDSHSSSLFDKRLANNNKLPPFPALRLRQLWELY
jgi:hypothetical protein